MNERHRKHYWMDSSMYYLRMSVLPSGKPSDERKVANSFWYAGVGLLNELRRLSNFRALSTRSMRLSSEAV